MTVEDLRTQLRALPPGTTFSRDAVLELLVAVRRDGEPLGELEVFTVADLAQRWHRSGSAVRAILEAGQVAGSWKQGGKAWRVPRAGVLAYEAAQAEAPEARATRRAKVRGTPGDRFGLRAAARGGDSAA